MKRRSFLKGAGAVAAGSLLPTVAGSTPAVIPPNDSPAPEVTPKPYTCPRCGSTTSYPVALQIRQSRAVGMITISEQARALSPTYTEACGECESIGIRVIARKQAREKK